MEPVNGKEMFCYVLLLVAAKWPTETQQSSAQVTGTEGANDTHLEMLPRRATRRAGGLRDTYETKPRLIKSSQVTLNNY
jgi:hypothetical protein